MSKTHNMQRLNKLLILLNKGLLLYETLLTPIQTCQSIYILMSILWMLYCSQFFLISLMWMGLSIMQLCRYKRLMFGQDFNNLIIHIMLRRYFVSCWMIISAWGNICLSSWLACFVVVMLMLNISCSYCFHCHCNSHWSFS